MNHYTKLARAKLTSQGVRVVCPECYRKFVMNLATDYCTCPYCEYKAIVEIA